MARTGADSTTSLSRSIENAVLVAAAEVRRTDLQDDVAALPVVRRETALAGVVHAAGLRGPSFSASMAFADIEPKLIAEMLISESGRNALARPRGHRAPSRWEGPPSPWSCGSEAAKVRCLMIA